MASAPHRLVADTVALISPWSRTGTPASGMPVRWYTCDRLTPATVWLTPWKMATWPPSVPT